MVTIQVNIENGRQVIVLPPDMQLDSKEVTVNRVGRALVLVPTDESSWNVMQASLGEFTEDYMADRAQPQNPDQRTFFE
jgi:virulence-associated protein VagC